jgi:hypothetical protein
MVYIFYTLTLPHSFSFSAPLQFLQVQFCATPSIVNHKKKRKRGGGRGEGKRKRGNPSERNKKI